VIKHNIDLARFLPKGQVECEHKDNMIYMTTNRAIPTRRFDAEHLSINSYIYLPDKYKLPLRIDIIAKIDAPGLYMLIGKGHINFGTLWSDNRRIDDIVAPARKTKHFHNYMAMNEFTNISLLYDLNEMQIMINGEERYYSKKERYMKSPAFREMNKDGFEIKIACDKLVNLCIKSVSITEYNDTCGIFHPEMELPAAITKNNAIIPGEKPAFEKCISLLPKHIQVEIVKIDEYIKTLRSLKFKRQIEKNGNKITYVSSDYGFSYAIYLSNDIFDHSLQWYIITNGKPETWHRKADMMEETLNRLAHKTLDSAERMFNNLDECVGCYKNCLVKTQYQLHDKQKNVCHGKLKFKMSASGFEDIRTFIEEINHLAQETVL
jgi:hypothetical protein